MSTPFDALRLERRGVDEGSGGPSPGAGSRRRRGPCAARAGPAPAAPAPAGRPTSARPRRRAAPRPRPGTPPARRRSAPSPCASIEQPPIRRSTNSNEWPPRRATACSARTASAVTSGPMPSPGRTTIVAFMPAFLPRFALGGTRAARPGDGQPVLDGVDEGDPARLDDVRARAHGAPAPPAATACRSRTRVIAAVPFSAVEDAHLVVAQVQLVDPRVVAARAPCAARRRARRPGRRPRRRCGAARRRPAP